MISFLSFILWRPGKVEDNDRKPYTSASVYSSRFDWWPTIENCIVHLLTSHSLTKYHWQFDHHHTYPGGSSPQDPIVFFLPEFFSLRSLLKSKRVPEKTSISALLTMPKPLTVWITRNCGQFWKRWEYQTTWPASWEICMQVRKQQLELDMEQQTSSK